MCGYVRPQPCILDSLLDIWPIQVVFLPAFKMKDKATQFTDEPINVKTTNDGGNLLQMKRGTAYPIERVNFVTHFLLKVNLIDMVA